MADKMTVETAAYRMFEQNFDCSQIVLSHFADDLDAEEEDLLKVASAFGGGISGMGRTCGCVTGALMALGMKYGFNEEKDDVGKKRIGALAHQFMDKFAERCGSTECRELLGVDVSNPDEASKAFDVIRTRCPGFATAACDILDEMLED